MGWFGRTDAFVSVLLFALLACKSEGMGYERAINCKRVECPSYQVIYTEKEYEIRQYEDAHWMSTLTINSSSFNTAVDTGFAMLFSYIQGNNNQGAKIEMTAPVIVDIHPSTGPFCNSSFVVYFYMPRKYQNSANPPTSHQTQLSKLPPKTGKLAAARRFDGFMNDGNVASEVLFLTKILKNTPWKAAVKSSGGAPATYSVAGYNSPLEYDNRVNEVIVWFNK